MGTVHTHQDKATLAPLDVDQLDFYVLPHGGAGQQGTDAEDDRTVVAAVKLGSTKVGSRGGVEGWGGDLRRLKTRNQVSVAL